MSKCLRFEVVIESHILCSQMNYSDTVEWLKRRINKTEQNGSENVETWKRKMIYNVLKMLQHASADSKSLTLSMFIIGNISGFFVYMLTCNSYV